MSKFGFFLVLPGRTGLISRAQMPAFTQTRTAGAFLAQTAREQTYLTEVWTFGAATGPEDLQGPHEEVLTLPAKRVLPKTKFCGLLLYL